jgi:hypothetical protein
MKVSIFRVEDADGAGPYNGTSWSDELMDMIDEHVAESHPSPHTDPMLNGIYPDEVCGFATIDAAEEWFAGYADALADAGFHLSVYTVPLADVRYGKEQALFRRGTLYPIRTMSIA